MKQLIFFIYLLASSFSMRGQWNQDTLVRNAVCTAANTQFSPQLCSDGNSGAIITWTDVRANPAMVYAQRIDSNGVLKWTNNGILVSAGAQGALPAYAVADGSGGAIVVYEPSILGGETHVHVQRLDANGNAQWGLNGIRLDTIGTSRLNNSVLQVIAEDGSGGAFITWRHYLFGTDEIRVQHITHNGTLLWGAQGLAVSGNTTVHYSSKIINTGNNTCLVAYEQQGKLLLQRLGSAGTKMWGATDLQVTGTMTTITTNNFFLLQTSAKNIAIAWEDTRNGNIDIYTQKIDSNGVVKWPATGRAADSTPSFTTLPELAADTSDGFFVVYHFNQAAVQHMNAAGQALWGNAGKPLSTSGNQTNSHCWSDGNNGVIVSWEDHTQGVTQRIYAQHYDYNGTALWRPDGLAVAITGNGGVRANHQTLGLNSGRVIAAWEDYRNGTGNQDIFAARFGNNAVLSTGFAAAQLCLGDSTQFTDLTTSTASTVNYWRWDFGDASAAGTGKTPKHRYAAKGVYTVTLTLMDNEFNYRVVSQQVTIGSTALVNIGRDTSICSGSSLVLDAGNPGALYTWSTGAATQTLQATTPGTYWVQVSNGGCLGADTMVLGVLPLPAAGFTYTANSLSVNFSNTSGNAVAYSWLFGDGGSSSTASPVHDYTAAGKYTVKLMATNSCKTDSTVQTIALTKQGGTPADSCGNALAIKLYPIPVHELLYIKFFLPASATINMVLYNSIGQRMGEYQLEAVKCSDVKQLDMKRLAGGVYFLEITDGKTKLLKKIVKQ